MESGALKILGSTACSENADFILLLSPQGLFSLALKPTYLMLFYKRCGTDIETQKVPERLSDMC